MESHAPRGYYHEESGADSAAAAARESQAFYPPVQYERLTRPSSSRRGAASSTGGYASPASSSAAYASSSPVHTGAAGLNRLSKVAEAASRPAPAFVSSGSSSPSLLPPVRVLEAGIPKMTRAITTPPTIEKEFECSMDATAHPGSGLGATPSLLRKSTPSQSENGTPYAAVMDEWLNQLRTPTPDVTLLPSPYDFNRERPTPIEKREDLQQLHDALLPTPPPDIHAKNQETKNDEYISSSGRRPLVEDIASLCRDLISQDINREGPRGKHLVPPLSVMTYRNAGNDFSSMAPIKEESKSGASTPTNSVSGSTTSKGKRRKMCTSEGCTNLSRSRGLCKAHGGGRRCSVDGCTRASQSGSLCITHGGGKRCTVDGCVKAAQSRGMCKAHGGGVRCRVEGCDKSSQGDGFCRTHGGGRRCGHPSGCTKWAQRNGMCMAHSEGKYGNSYRGRMARMQEGVTHDDDDEEEENES